MLRYSLYRRGAALVAGLLACGAAAVFAGASALGFPNNATSYSTYNGCETAQNANATIQVIDSTTYDVLSVYHEDYNGCAQLVHSQGKINDGAHIIATSMVADPTFAQPSDLLADYYYYGHAWGKAGVDGTTSSPWGTVSVAP